jgi:hypothetical protein
VVGLQVVEWGDVLEVEDLGRGIHTLLLHAWGLTLFRAAEVDMEETTAAEDTLIVEDTQTVEDQVAEVEIVMTTTEATAEVVGIVMTTTEVTVVEEEIVTKTVILTGGGIVMMTMMTVVAGVERIATAAEATGIETDIDHRELGKSVLISRINRQ